MFLPPNKLPTKNLDFIRRELEDIISRSSEQKNNVKVKSFGLFTSDSKKLEVQDLLDSILKIAYPYISQARKLTDMNKHLEYSFSNSGAGLKFRLLPEALPEGYEDRTPVIIGFQTNKEGIKSVVKVQVWKERTHVWYEHRKAWFYKPITSMAEPVNMKDAESMVTISATGGGRGISSGLCGDYTLTEELHNDRAVYRNSEGWHLYGMEGGAWAVGPTVGGNWPYYRSTSPAPSPGLCQTWEYRERSGSEYKPGDNKVTFKNSFQIHSQ